MRIGSFEFSLKELAGSVLANMAISFVAGTLVHYLLLSKDEECPPRGGIRLPQ